MRAREREIIVRRQRAVGLWPAGGVRTFAEGGHPALLAQKADERHEERQRGRGAVLLEALEQVRRLARPLWVWTIGGEVT